MQSYLNVNNFIKYVVAFWSLWWLSALYTDVIGGMAHLGIIQRSWAPDLNYPNLVDALSIYPLPHWCPPLIFLSIILWMVLIVLCFFRAFLHISRNHQQFLKSTNQAFCVSMIFWFAFFLADQMVMKYDLLANHMIQGGFQLLCWSFITSTIKNND